MCIQQSCIASYAWHSDEGLKKINLTFVTMSKDRTNKKQQHFQQETKTEARERERKNGTIIALLQEIVNLKLLERTQKQTEATSWQNTLQNWHRDTELRVSEKTMTL